MIFVHFLLHINQGTNLFIGAARGAAAATANRFNEVFTAASELQIDLEGYRNTIKDFADVIEETGYESPVLEIQEAREEFDNAIAEARAVCDDAGGDDCATLNDLLDEATDAFQDAQDTLVPINSFTLVDGFNPLFPDITLEEFHTFLENTAIFGADALPIAEIDLSDRILLEAEVFFPGMDSFGPAIAAYDAQGDTGGRESALFDPITETLNLAELLRGSATTLSPNGAWLNIDLQTSELVEHVRKKTPEPSSILGFLAFGTLGAASTLKRKLKCSKSSNII